MNQDVDLLEFPGHLFGDPLDLCILGDVTWFNKIAVD